MLEKIKKMLKSECDKCGDKHYIWNLYDTAPCYWLCVDCKVEHDTKI